MWEKRSRVNPARRPDLRPSGKPSGGDPGKNKTNIAYHYDVSNAFYRLFLDPEMVYTCAYFQPEWHDDLARERTPEHSALQPGVALVDLELPRAVEVQPGLPAPLGTRVLGAGQRGRAGGGGHASPGLGRAGRRAGLSP